MIKNHWHGRQSTAASAAAQKVQTRPESIYKRYSWEGSGAQGRATPFRCCSWLDCVYRGLPKWEVVSWVAQVDRRLAVIAATQPYAAYATFIFGLLHRCTLQHTMAKASEHMQLLKDAIHGKLISMPSKH